MAILTKLNRDDIAGLLGNFPAAPHAPFTFQGIPEGSVNTFYRIAFGKTASCFLRIDEVGNRARLENELRILTLLEKHRKRLSAGFNFPLRTRAGHLYMPFRDKFALLFPAIPGRSRFGRELSPAHLNVIGAKLAEWHRLPPDPMIRPHRFDLKGQHRVFRDIRAVVRKRNPSLYAFISAKLLELGLRSPVHEKKVLIHADLFPDNLLWTGKRLSGILDLDAAGLGPALFDIGVCLHALCYDERKFQRPKARAFLAGYRSVQRLTAKDEKNLPYYLELSAMRFLLTRLKDFEFPARDRKLAFYKDYRVYEKRFGEMATEMGIIQPEFAFKFPSTN